MIALALVPLLHAGNVYINGVRADLLPEITIQNATVRFDAQGNVWVDAPGYRVQVLPSTEYVAPATPSAPPRDNPVVAAGGWWLVTEDEQSVGRVVDVLVNGALVRRVTSGEPQLILDLAPFLRPGANFIVVSPNTGPSRGSLNIYVGRGSNRQGTIHLDNPDVAWRAADSTSARQYTLTVP